MSKPQYNREFVWYFAGLSGSAAIAVVHPMDLLKVHLQTQQERKFGLFRFATQAVARDGAKSLLNGMSAAIARQLSYTTIRVGFYQEVSQWLRREHNYELNFLQKIGLATMTAICGVLVGNPFDVIVVRMQNDVKLPIEQRRNYKNVFDGIWRVVKEEGPRKLATGLSMHMVRGSLVTVGQVAFYDQTKHLLLQTGYFKDTVFTHLLTSIMAGGAASVLVLPADTLKSRIQSAKPGRYPTIMSAVIDLARAEPFLLGFYKGFIPMFVAVAPYTVIFFTLSEQLRLRFGREPKPHLNT